MGDIWLPGTEVGSRMLVGGTTGRGSRGLARVTSLPCVPGSEMSVVRGV